LGYGPDNRLKVKITTRDLPFFRDPAVILIDQLKEIYVDGELDTIDSTIWLPNVMRKDYVVGLNLSGSGPRSRPEPLPALRVRRRLELQRPLQSGDRRADRSTVDRGQSGDAQTTGLGKSNGSWPRTVPARSCFTIEVAAAGSPM
jgi:hypothetical protein